MLLDITLGTQKVAMYILPSYDYRYRASTQRLCDMANTSRKLVSRTDLETEFFKDSKRGKCEGHIRRKKCSSTGSEKF